MSIPVAVSSTLMYLYFVRDWAYPVRMLYVVITYLLWSSICYTAINIPYGSMASVISPDIRGQGILIHFPERGGKSGGSGNRRVGAPDCIPDGRGGESGVLPERFTLTAVVFGVLSILCYALCYFLCRERVQLVKEKKERQTTRQLLQSLGRSKSLKALVGAALVLLLASLLGQTMNNYLFLDYFRNAKAMAAVNFVSIGGSILLAPFVSGIARRFGKKEAGAFGMLCAGILYLLLFVLRIKSIPVFMVLLFLATLGVGLFNLVIWAFITDIIDEQEVKTGSREDATVYAVYSFARKAGQALAGGVGGFVLTAIGYVSEAAVQSEAGIPADLYGSHPDSRHLLSAGICHHAVFLSAG